MMFGGGNIGGSMIGTGIIFSLKDQFSAAADKIKGKWKELEGVTEQATMRMEVAMNRVKMGFAGLAIGSALVAPMAIGLKTAMELEDKMADVRKTTGMGADEAERFKDALFGLDSRSSINDLIDIAKIGGSLGVATDQLYDFTKAVDMANVALGDEFTGGAEEISRALGTIKDLFDETKAMEYGEAMTKIGSALNELGAIGKATGANVSDFTQRIGQLGVFAPALNETLALGATLQEVGVNGEIAAGGLTALLTEATELTKMHDRMAEFAQQMGITRAAAEGLYNTSRGDFLMKFAKSFEGMLPADVGRRLKQLGVGGIEAQKVIGSLAANTELYGNRLSVVNEQLEIGNSLQKEFNVKNQTTGALVDKAKKKWVELKDALGRGLYPVMKPLVGLFMQAIDIAIKFVKTPVGKFAMAAAGAVGILVAGLSAFVIVGNGAKAMAAQLAIRFAAMGKAQTAAAFANGGLATGFGTLIKTIMTGNPYLIAAVAAIGLITAAVMTGKAAIEEYKGVMDGTREVAGGLRGDFQKLGGILFSIGEIWQSATTEGFSLSKKNADALKNLGIYEFVVSLGTWLVRLKAMFQGMGEGIMTIYEGVKTAVTWMVKNLDRLAEAFGFDLSKNLSSVERWIKVGKILGYIVGTILVAAFVAWGISMLPQLILVGLLVAAVWGLVWVFEKVSQAITWVINNFDELVNSIWNGFVELIEWWFSLPAKFVNWGVSVVQAIWNGIKSGWGWLTDQFLGLIRSLPGGSYILDFFGVGGGTSGASSGGGSWFNDLVPAATGGETGSVNMPVNSSTEPDDNSFMGTIGKMNAQKTVGSTASSSTHTEIREVYKNLNINIDGRPLKSWIDEQYENDDNRS